MTGVSPTASFLLPEGFAPPGAAAVLRESAVVLEAGRNVWHTVGERRRRRSTPYAERSRPRDAEPVVLVPGFLAGDGSLTTMAAGLRRAGRRTYRSEIHANVGCTRAAADQLESRIEAVAARRGSRVQVVGHSLGGMLARGIAVRRPDLVSGIVTLGSPVLAPGAHHLALSASLEVLVRLSGAGWRGLMAEDCVNGTCARASFAETRAPVPEEVSFTAVYLPARRDRGPPCLLRPRGHPRGGAVHPPGHGRGPPRPGRGDRGAGAPRPPRGRLPHLPSSGAGSGPRVSGRSRSRRKRVASPAGARR